MTGFIIEILKECRSAFGKFSLFIVQSGANLKKVVPVLDQCKAVILWLAELIAFIGIVALIIKGVLDIYSGNPAEGFMILSGSIILALLCLLLGMLMGDAVEPKPKQKQ
jgi:hypothetical protein